MVLNQNEGSLPLGPEGPSSLTPACWYSLSALAWPFSPVYNSTHPLCPISSPSMDCMPSNGRRRSRSNAAGRVLPVRFSLEVVVVTVVAVVAVVVAAVAVVEPAVAAVSSPHARREANILH